MFEHLCHLVVITFFLSLTQVSDVDPTQAVITGVAFAKFKQRHPNILDDFSV